MKTALLLSATILAHRVFSPPTPSAKSGSLARFGERDAIGGLVRWIPFVGQAAVWFSTLCETLVTLAGDQPITPLMRSILTTLTFGNPFMANRIHVTPLFVAGWLMAVIGGTLRLKCYRQLGRQFTYNLAIVDDHALVTTGLYSIVRHPSYAAWVMFTIGLVLMQLSPGSWIVECGLLGSMTGRIIVLLWIAYNLYIIVMLVPRMKQEDEVLKKQSGEQWVRRSKHTPYKLVPGLY